MIPKQFAHQKVSVSFCTANSRAFDLSDPGTGKTRVHIDSFVARRKAGKSRCALVLCPKSLMRSAWQDDFKKFAPAVITTVCPAEKREIRFQDKADVYITNIDAAVWLAKQSAVFFARFTDLIIDESSAFKHHTSARSKATNKIKKFFKFRYLLSGTPNTNSVTELWNQMFILDDGKRLSTSFFKFRQQVCVPKQVGPSANMVEWRDREGAALTVSKLIADIVIRHKFEECIDIPENHLYSVPYELTTKQLRTYKQMKDEAVAEVARGGGFISAINGAAVTTKLLQIASGAAYSGDTPGTIFVDNGRYELVADLVQQREHSIVFFNWQHQRDGLFAEMDARGLNVAVLDGSTPDRKRKELVDDYQNGMYDVLLAHPASAAHGLTLTRATTTIWASPTYNLEHFLQGNRRAYRAGQKRKTETIVVLAPGTIEEKVYAALQAKNVRQSDLLELAKEEFGSR